jgi:ATP-dependent Clp protease ATP-binding subunit ClpC
LRSDYIINYLSLPHNFLAALSARRRSPYLFWNQIDSYMKTDNQKIDPRGTIIGKAVNIDFIVSNPLIKIVWLVVWLAGIISIALFLDHSYPKILNFNMPIYGLAYIILGIFMFFLALRQFFVAKVRYPKQVTLDAISEAQGNINIFAAFSFALAKVWMKYLSDIEKKNSKDLLAAILKSADMNFILARIGIGEGQLEPLLSSKSGADITNIIPRALDVAKAESHHQIEVGDVFVAICELDPDLKKFISDLKLETSDIANIVYWQTQVIRENIRSRHRFFDPENLRLSGGVGRDWAYGFTLLLRQYSSDITASIASQGLGLRIIGHDRHIKAIEEALSRETGGNVVLVGEPGIGKKTTVLGFAKKIYEGKAMPAVNNKHIVQINIDSLLAGSGGPGEITQRVSQVLSEAASAGNIIIFIDHIENLLSSGDAGKVNAVEVLLPFLEAPDVHIIGTADMASFNRYIAPNSALLQRMTKIEIEEPPKTDMIRILEDVVPQIEYHTKSLVSYGGLKEAIIAADKYILNAPNPEKSINLLDGAAARASSERGETIITPEDIHTYVTEKFDVPSSEAKAGEKEKLLALEEEMHKRVVGQEEAIAAIANAMRRSRANITESKKPIGSFLFLGTTGVGKTETAKALSESYFGDEERMIRFDMSEYQNKADIYRLIGSNSGTEESPGILTSAVREKPFSLLLFDEIEKANPDILNLFLQILDEGRLTDGSGRLVSFTNSIIIATSNAGANLIRQSIGSGVEYEATKKTLMEYLQNENIYRPEFLNRFTGVIVFSPLSAHQIVQIAGIMIKKLQAVVFKNQGVKVEITSDGIQKLAQLGFDPQMGARPMARTIQEKVENILAKKLLASELKKGDTITFTSRDF